MCDASVHHSHTLQNRAALLLLLLSGGRGDGGKAMEGVGGRQLALLVGAGAAGCCSNGCAASQEEGVRSLSLKENKKF